MKEDDTLVGEPPAEIIEFIQKFEDEKQNQADEAVSAISIVDPTKAEEAAQDQKETVKAKVEANAEKARSKTEVVKDKAEAT